MNGIDDLSYLGFRILRIHQLKHRPCFLNAILRDQPARAGWDAEEHRQKEKGWKRRDAELPAPFGRAKSHPRDAIVGKISQQNADDDIDLKEAHQPAADLRRGQLSYIDRTQDG